MEYVCVVCGEKIVMKCPLEGEIISCPHCGTEYIFTVTYELEELELEGEDWGE